MSSLISVAIPVLNAGPVLADTLAAVSRQRLDRELEIVVCDSGSTDGSDELARSAGATVSRISHYEFSHRRTRNLLMSRCRDVAMSRGMGRLPLRIRCLLTISG